MKEKPVSLASRANQLARVRSRPGKGGDGPPDFRKLLNRPAVKLALPKDFDNAIESSHLAELWQETDRLRSYAFEEFIHAGGSGIVFRVKDHASGSTGAMKLARKKIFQLAASPQKSGGISQSPFSDTEVSALARVSHPNVVSLRDRIVGRAGVVAIVTSYVDRPQPLDEYFRDILSKDPDPKRTKGIMSFSPVRLENACAFLVARCQEMAAALAHMHERQLYHCDVKPANILIGAQRQAILTDLGSCIAVTPTSHSKKNDPIRIRFTWTYAHPELRDIGKDVRSISGGGLKVSVNVDPGQGLQRFDLFAFGRTIQEALASLVGEFGERCYASFGFRFLHVIACLLLDGRNAPLNGRIAKNDGRRFVSDVALDYPAVLYGLHRIRSADELLERLGRFSRDYSWNGRIPELDGLQPDYVNTGAAGPAPFTPRIAAIFKHPAVRRLRDELQLGWVRECYPGATHTRWSHTLGVLANVAGYYNALLADTDLPTARILLGQSDIEHAFVAAILHDLGQTAFGHDLEAVNLPLFNHESFVPRLLDDRSLGPETLRQTIGRHWPGVSIERVLNILDIPSRGPDGQPLEEVPVDGLARDAIDGPIDADKLDYLIRDSTSCGVPYGSGIDKTRFLQALTVHARQSGTGKTRLALAYRAKGAAAVQSLLLARYQLYGAVYWHHTFRCIQAMFVQAASTAFAREKAGSGGFERAYDSFYRRVVCGRDGEPVVGHRSPKRQSVPDKPPKAVTEEPTLEFVWHFADSRHRRLIERLAVRELYKRVYEVRTSELFPQVDYAILKENLAPAGRPELARTLERSFVNSIHRAIADRHGSSESVSEFQARDIAQKLEKSDLPLIVVDYPVKGIPDEMNIPTEISDASRKYISGRSQESIAGREAFHKLRQMQIESASVRVFAEPLLHELIIRYLDPQDVRACAFEAMPFLNTQK